MLCPMERCTQLPDIAVDTEADPSPTYAENVKVDVSKEFFAETLASMASAVPIRCDNTKMWPTIYKVPKQLKRGVEDEGYEPAVVRLGPFTKKNKSTAQLDKFKWCCVRQLMGLHQDQDHPDSDVTAGLLNSCLESMKRLEPEIRASYSEDIGGDGNDLALNMLLDGCFILYRLLKAAREGGIALAQDDDWTQVFGRVWVWQLVEIDLLLLENQIPFFVLSKLFELLCSRDDEPMESLVKGSLRFFRSICPHMLRSSSANAELDYRGVRVHHLLHLLYLSSHQPADVLVLERTQWIPCAKELEEVGVRLRKRNKADSFLDIRFDSRSGVLEIPPLQLYDFSDKLLRNLIAFEQTYPDTWCDITAYAVFMDCLIKTPEDMRILHLRGILVNQIKGEQDASRFFSRICAQLRWQADSNYLKDVMDKVNNYRGSRLHKWRAALVRNYFSNPWVAMSVLAAVLLLAMAILQTTFTVYPYFNPPK